MASCTLCATLLKGLTIILFSTHMHIFFNSLYYREYILHECTQSNYDVILRDGEFTCMECYFNISHAQPTVTNCWDYLISWVWGYSSLQCCIWWDIWYWQYRSPPWRYVHITARTQIKLLHHFKFIAIIIIIIMHTNQFTNTTHAMTWAYLFLH